MNQLVAWLGSIGDLILVVVGFGLIIFVHELGHFLAAKWAGIRVLAFAIGFGRAAVSYRKGMGFRRGSSEAEHQTLVRRGEASAISPTEYRLNWLPFGGYVKMLGQDDVNPAAVSDAPDSYQSTPIWKRMVVISAGVVFNIIAAALLFIAVFMHGLENEPPKVGIVTPGLPASRAIPVNAPDVAPGLRAGDVVLTIDGRQTRSFNDIIMASAMSRKGEAMDVAVQRPGREGVLEFQVRPEMGSQSRLLEIGVAPAFSGTIANPKPESERELVRTLLERHGLKGVEPGSTLVSVAGIAVRNGVADLVEAARNSDGQPLAVEFRSPDGRIVNAIVSSKAELQHAQVRMPNDAMASTSHLLGLIPVMKVADGATGDLAPQQGLREGDIFVRVGSVQYPSLTAGMAEIRRNKGKQIDVTVLRRGDDGALQEVVITPAPTVKKEAEGRIGFVAGEADETNLLAMPPSEFIDAAGKGQRPPAAGVINRPGYRLTAINGKPVENFTQIRTALRDATKDALARSEAGQVTLSLELRRGEHGDSTVEQAAWTIQPEDVRALHELSWLPNIELAAFDPEEFILVAHGANFFERAYDAVKMGLSETNRVMLMTYATFVRLFEGTVKVEHLKGPVGIAHMGTRIASKGMTWLLFFMALISVNLAVVNFLPLPIVDGGQFIFLVLEKIRGRPLSIEVQNVATIAGLLLIGTVFIIVTFQDIANLFG